MAKFISTTQINLISESEIENLDKNQELSKSDWVVISYKRDLSEEFIEKFYHKLYMDTVIYSSALSDEQLIKYFDKVQLINILSSQKLSDKFIEYLILNYETHADNTMLNLDCFLSHQISNKNRMNYCKKCNSNKIYMLCWKYCDEVIMNKVLNAV